jgi:hypothetical protein
MDCDCYICIVLPYFPSNISCWLHPLPSGLQRDTKVLRSEQIWYYASTPDAAEVHENLDFQSEREFSPPQEAFRSIASFIPTANCAGDIAGQSTHP